MRLAERGTQVRLHDLADELVDVPRAVDVVRDAALGRTNIRIVVQIALAVEGLLADRELLADVGDCGARGQQSVGLPQLGDDLIGGVFFAFHRESPFPRQRHSRCRSGDSHSNWLSFRGAVRIAESHDPPVTETPRRESVRGVWLPTWQSAMTAQNQQSTAE
jgi:hypothetical protein